MRDFEGKFLRNGRIIYTYSTLFPSTVSFFGVCVDEPGSLHHLKLVFTQITFSFCAPRPTTSRLLINPLEQEF